jgi:hypothetical protein
VLIAGGVHFFSTSGLLVSTHSLPYLGLFIYWYFVQTTLCGQGQ